MDILTLVTLVLLVGTLLSFVFAALFFFKSSPGRSFGTFAVKSGAVAGLILHPYGVWHAQTDLLNRQLGLGVLTAAGVLFGFALWRVQGFEFNEVFGKVVAKKLIRDGVFLIFRHPFYVSYSLAYVGASLAGGNTYQWIHSYLMIALYFAAAVREERKLKNVPIARSSKRGKHAAA